LISIQKLIDQYCSGDSSAAEELLLRFSPYILKFRQLLFAGIFNPSDVESVKFLRLFGRRDISEVAEWLSRKLRGAYTISDIEQDLRLCLLLCARRYGKIKGYYVYVLYKYVVRNLIKDPLVRNWSYSLSVGPRADIGDESSEDNFEELTRELNAADQELLRLVYRDGFSVMDAAEKVGYTHGQARVRMHRIRLMLKDKLAEGEVIDGS